MKTEAYPINELVRGMGQRYYDLTATPDNLTAPVSKSMLWQFIQSPYKWYHGQGFQTTDAMDFGSLVHCLCFTPDDVDNQYIVAPYADFRKVEAREWRREQESTGLTVVKEEDMLKAENMREHIMESEYVWSLGVCDYEVAAFGKIQDTIIKGMIDIVPHSDAKLVDLKTTKSIGSKWELQRKVANMGYHAQAALYLDLYNNATGEKRNQFEFVFVETDDPHEMAVVSLTPNFIEKGRTAYLGAVNRWQRCVADKVFPPALEGIVELDAPDYA